MPDPSDPPEQTADAVAAAARELYAARPEDFLATRTALVQRLRADGDAAAAKAVGALRKPTAAAWMVNALVLAQPELVDRLAELGDRLRAAQDAFDAAALRELGAERRATIAEVTGQVVTLSAGEGRRPSPALRDEVHQTIEAAIADPDVLARLGRLERAEHWSGFGFGADAVPALTLVRGGKGEGRTRAAASTAAPAKKAPGKGATKTAASGTEHRRGRTDAAPREQRPAAPPRPSAAERRRREARLATLRTALETASAALDEAQAEEKRLEQEISALGKQIEALRQRREEARSQRERLRGQLPARRREHRTALSALTRAEREDGDG